MKGLIRYHNKLLYVGDEIVDPETVAYVGSQSDQEMTSDQYTVLIGGQVRHFHDEVLPAVILAAAVAYHRSPNLDNLKKLIDMYLKHNEALAKKEAASD